MTPPFHPNPLQGISSIDGGSLPALPKPEVQMSGSPSHPGEAREWSSISAPFLRARGLRHLPLGYFGVLVARSGRGPPRSASFPLSPAVTNAPLEAGISSISAILGFFLAKHTKPTPKKNLKPAAPPPVPPGLRAGGTPPSPPCQPPALRGGAGFEGAGDPPSPEFWGLGKLGTSPPQVFGFGRGSGRRGDTLICPFHHPPWWHPRIPALYSPAPDFGV